MIVRRFLLWARDAGAQDRATAAGALAAAYVRNELSADDMREAQSALLSLLDDASPLVRRRIAEEVAGATNAPRALVLGLSQDQSDIASIVLSHSPLLAEADLVDAAAVGDSLCQRAIAHRPYLPAGVCAALAEVATAEALIALAGNLTAEVPAWALERMVERAGDDGALREALLARRDCPVALRKTIADRVAASLMAFVSDRGWMTQERCARVSRDASDRVVITLAACGPRDAAEVLVAQLRNEGRLTAGLILRSLLSGDPSLAESAFAALGDLPVSRAAQLMHDRRGVGFRALYRKANMPPSLFPAFLAAVSALNEIGFAPSNAARAGVSRRIVERVLIACDGMPEGEAGALLALLRRLDAEAAREEARTVAEGLADDAALAMLIELDPNLLVELDVIDHRQAA